jgi:hypothetical protein
MYLIDIHRNILWQLPVMQWLQPLLYCLFFYFVVALLAIYGLIAAGFKRNQGFFAALSANGRIHLAGFVIMLIGITPIALGFSDPAAVRTALGFVSEPFGGKKLLFFYRKCKLFAAVYACNDFFLKRHT